MDQTSLEDGKGAWPDFIPTRWGLVRARECFVERVEKSKSGEEELLSVSQFYGVKPTKSVKKSESALLSRAASLVGYKVVKKSDLVVNTMLAWNGSMGVAPIEGIVSPAYAVYQPLHNTDSKFFQYLLTTPLFKGVIKSWSSGIQDSRMRLYPNKFFQITLPVPSLEEQGLIVRYLDHAELRIAKAIAAKQALMNRLLELRHVQIAEGILGSDGARLLNSSLPYNLPGSWRVEPFWSVAPEVSISGQQGKELLSVYLNRGVIRYSESAGQVHKPSLDLSGYQLVRPGDLVLNNQQAWRGSVGVSRYEGIVSPAYVVCSLGDRFDLEYANMLFRSPAMVSQFEMASRGVGSIQRQLHRQTLRVMKVPIPPMEEQVQIAKRLVAATKGLDLAIQSLETEIALLKEYRTRLISDVVTGKLNVREEAANLPGIDPMELATVSIGENVDDEEATDDE